MGNMVTSSNDPAKKNDQNTIVDAHDYHHNKNFPLACARKGKNVVWLARECRLGWRALLYVPIGTVVSNNYIKRGVPQ